MTPDDVFLQQFESRTLPFAQWTHRAHLKIAYLYLTRMNFEAAAQKVCDGIRAYNTANNVLESPTRGYHQTTTMAWLHIIAAMLAEYGPAATTDEFIDAQPQLTKKSCAFSTPANASPLPKPKPALSLLTSLNCQGKFDVFPHPAAAQ